MTIVRALACCLLALAVLLPARAAVGLPEKVEKVYGHKSNAPSDRDVGGWYVNLGPTGARVSIHPEAPKALVVRYVFEGSPAFGKLKVGDKIVGIAGTPFATAHKFGYGMAFFGSVGPTEDVGNAIEALPAKRRGTLELDVVRGSKQRTAKIRMPFKDGGFAATYPKDCPKSEAILDTTLAYLAEKQRGDGLWHQRPHINAFAALALLASGEKRYKPHVTKAAKAFARDTKAEDMRGAYLGWHYGLAGIVLGEYYLATKSKWVLRELQEIHDWLVAAQAPRGGWGHRKWDHPEGNGYGPICMITGQIMMAFSLMQRCGIDVDKKTYDRTQAFIARGTSARGYVWYKDQNAGDKKYADMGRTGAAVLAHALSPTGGTAFRDYALRGAKLIGEHPEPFPDTHGCPLLGQGWTALAAMLDPAAYRSLMDSHRWFWNLSRNPDGTFIYQPNRDSNPQDYAAAPRLSATAMTALVFAAPRGHLQMIKPPASGAPTTGGGK